MKNHKNPEIDPLTGRKRNRYFLVCTHTQALHAKNTHAHTHMTQTQTKSPTTTTAPLRSLAPALWPEGELRESNTTSHITLTLAVICDKTVLKVFPMFRVCCNGHPGATSKTFQLVRPSRGRMSWRPSMSKVWPPIQDQM